MATDRSKLNPTVVGYGKIAKTKSKGDKFSVTEFNANPEVKRKMGILFTHLNDNSVSGAGLLGIKETSEEFLNNPAESMRDEILSISTLANRRSAINNGPEHVKKAYDDLLHMYNNETEIKGFKEGAEATKDYTIDLFTSPENLIGGKFLVGKTALQTAGKSSLFSGLWSGSDNYIRQSRDVEINALDKISNKQVLQVTAAGAALGGTIGYGGHKLAKYIKDRVDLNLENRIEGQRLEVETAIDQTTAITSKEIPQSEIDLVRNSYLEAERELALRNTQFGNERPPEFVRAEARREEPLLFGESATEGLGLRSSQYRTPLSTPAPVKLGPHKKTSDDWTTYVDQNGIERQRRKVGAYYDKTDKIIYIDKDFIAGQFKDKPWENPKVKGVVPLPKEFTNKYIKTPEDWVRFVELHEKSHTEFLQLEPKNMKSIYENRINNIAMAEMSDPRLFPSPETIAFNKRFGGAGQRSDEELNDIIRSTFIQLEGMPEAQISAGLNNALGKWANSFGSNILFKPAALLNNFKQSSVAQDLQRKFRYDAQRDWFGPRKYDKQDFGEVFKETLGNSYVPFKMALEPIQSTMTGEISRDINTVLVAAVQGTITNSSSQTINTASKKIRTVLDDIGDELFESGAIKNKVESNYFPRSWKREEIEKNADNFKNLLIRSGEVDSIEAADDLVINMLNKKNQLDQGGSGGGASFFYKRAFTKLKDNDFVDYLDTDMNSVMINYIAQSSKAIAKRKVFGVNNLEEFTSFYINGIDAQMTKAGKALTLKDKKDLQKLYNHATGENLQRFEGKPGFALDLYGSINRMAYLPLATISSLTEVFINVAKAGPKSSIKGLYGALKDARKTTQDKVLEKFKKQGLTEQESWRELQEFGMNLDPIIMDTVERLSGSLIRNQSLQKANNTFFRVTFLDQWTKFVQLASYKTGKDLISKNLREINKLKTTSDSSRISNMKDQLNELGVDIEKGLKWVDDGASLDSAFYKDIKRGAARYTNEVILMPSAESGLKPFWTADPKSSILFQFLGYPIAFSNTILKNAFKDVARNPTQNGPKVLAAGLIMTEMARWTNWARSKGKSEEGKTDQEIYANAFYRWGGNGVGFDLVKKGHEAAKVYQDPIAGITTALGPVGNDVYKTIRRGDIVRLLGEKVPGYGALGFLSPEAKKAYTQWLKDKSKESKKALIEILSLERDEEPLKFNRVGKSQGGKSGSKFYSASSNAMEEGAERIFNVDKKVLRANEKEARDLVNSLVEQGLINKREQVKLRDGQFKSGDVFNAANHMFLANIAKDSTIKRAALQGKEYVQQLAGDTGPHGAVGDRENNALGFKFYDKANGDKESFKKLVSENLVKRFGERVNKDKGGEVDVPKAPTEPDDRIDKMTGLPYNLQAGIAFRDEEDPLKRLGLVGGGRVVDPLSKLGFSGGGHTTYKQSRIGFEKGGFFKKLIAKAESTADFSNTKQMALAKKVGFTEENINDSTQFGKSYGKGINTQDGGRGDAARHMMLGWSAAQTKNPDSALTAINFRDVFTGLPAGEGVRGISMDIHNNKLGFSLGKLSKEEAQEQMDIFLNNNKAKVRRR